MGPKEEGRGGNGVKRKLKGNRKEGRAKGREIGERGKGDWRREEGKKGRLGKGGRGKGDWRREEGEREIG